MGNPTIRTVTDAAALARLYTDILEPSFPPSERVTRTDFVEGGASGALDVLAAQDDDGYLGAIVGERFGNGYLVNWLAVNGARRGGGTGSALITAGITRWIAEPGIDLVLAEIERPDLFEPHPKYGDPARRLAFYHRLGATLLDLPYYQPPISEGLPRVRNLLLIVLAARDDTPPPRTLNLDETAAVRTMLHAAMGSLEEGDAETAQVYAAVDSPSGVRLLPLTDYAQVPVLDQAR